MFKSTLIVFLVVALTSIKANSITYSNDINWRVVGGQEAAKGQFPFIISLRVGNSHNCGGSVLGGKWIVTAAHCVVGWQPSSLTVVAGTNQLNQGGVYYTIEKLLPHPKYNPSSIYNDIALIKLNEPVELGDLVQKIALDINHIDEPQPCTLIGWGRTSYPGSIPNNLQFLEVVSITFNDCKSRWVSNPIVESEICTLTKINEGACHGDSGGPLVTIKDGKPTLTGLVSWGSPCARGLPDVYTRVSSFIDWVKETIDDNSIFEE